MTRSASRPSVSTDVPKRGGPRADRAALLRALEAAADDVTLRIDGHDVSVTTLDRVYWPAVAAFDQAPITKRDFLRYLVTVADAMLPHLADRPLTLFRWPNGVAARRVLQKHWDIALPPFIERVQVFSDAKHHPDEYVLCNDLASLLWFAHMGVLEFHVWHSRVRPGPDAITSSTDFASSTLALQASLLEYPDYILFDIDPFIYSGTETRPKDPELNAPAYARVLAVAQHLKAVLDGMRLTALVKTSGKSGLHVLVPIRRTVPYRVVRELAHVVGQHLMRAHPGAITMQWSVDRRTGKVFIDANMNVRAKSMTAPYSPRGLPGAPVSMPLPWETLGHAYPTDFRITTVPAWLAQHGDPWRGWLARKVPIETLLRAG